MYVLQYNRKQQNLKNIFTYNFTAFHTSQRLTDIIYST